MAACLTPHGPGGVAVIQIVGPNLGPKLEPHLRKRSASSLNLQVELPNWPSDRLRLCQIVEGNEVLDDAIVAVRASGDGDQVVDLSVHGGPRIVQRVLLLLQRAGITPAMAEDVDRRANSDTSLLDLEAREALRTCKTRLSAKWLMSAAQRLREAVNQIEQELASNHLEAVRERIGNLLGDAKRIRCLLEGVRVVITGPVNAGKSTLANLLAQRNQAIISDVPGTTRDWTEHPAAIRGIPFVFVDTAGVRFTGDPLEVEAIRRGAEQLHSADLVINLFDGSRPPDGGMAEVVRARSHQHGPPRLYVWNKSDLGLHEGTPELLDLADSRGIVISGETGQGMQALQVAMLAALDLSDEPWNWSGPFTDRQCKVLQRLENLFARPCAADIEESKRLLQAIVGNCRHS